MAEGKTEQAGAMRTLRAAFPVTIPVLTGYVCMGMAFGILLASKGFGPFWAFVMSVCIYAGSAQFVAVGLLAAGFAPLSAFLVILMVNARHVFYGIPLLARFNSFGRFKWYMIFSLTDETFALLISTKAPKGVDEVKMHRCIAVLDHLYWIVGCVLGGIIGSAIPFDTRGIDFVMTALFVVILLEQWKEKQNRLPALIGLGTSLLCRLAFGAEWFVPAAMLGMVLIFVGFRRPLEAREGVQE